MLPHDTRPRSRSPHTSGPPESPCGKEGDGHVQKCREGKTERQKVIQTCREGKRDTQRGREILGGGGGGERERLRETQKNEERERTPRSREA